MESKSDKKVKDKKIEKKDKKNKILDKKICEKCKQNKSSVYNRNKFLCLDCFNEIIIHKFKANLRTCCKIKHEDYILVCISGGNFSMSMLEMFRQSFNESKSNKKLFFKIKILYIDDSLFLKDKEKIIEERNKRKEFLNKILTAYKFDYQIINLEKVMDLNNEKINLNDNEIYENDLIEKYLNLLNRVPSMGGFKKKFIQITINNLIFFYSLKNKFIKITFGNNGQGKIIIYRPLQDFFDKEILYFNHYSKVQLIYPVYQDDKLTSILSSFIGKLQSEKLNTVPAVINTAEKVILYKNEKICKFCLANMDKNMNQLEFGLDNFLNDENCILNKELCYGCRRIFSEVIQNYFDEEAKEKSIIEINSILNMFKYFN